VSNKSPEEKLMAARCRLMTREPWYGHMAMSMEWHESDMSWIEDENARTIGVRITSKGIPECYYYKRWVESQSLKEIYGAVQHVIGHLVRLHCLRTGNRDMGLWGKATDMVVNGKRQDPRVGYKDNGRLTLPDTDMVFIPNQWPDDATAEQYYLKLEKDSPPQKGKNKGKGQGQGQGQGGQGQQQGNGKGKPGNKPGGGTNDDGSKQVDDHSIWNQSNISEDQARQIVHDMVVSAADKSQGHVPGNLAEIIKALSKPIVHWREIIRQWLGNHVGNKRKTYSRRDRRREEFGRPGISHHAAARVSVIVDTSGSISTKELEQFFAEIDMISTRAKVMVLQWDHAYQGHGWYRRGDWKNFQVNGRGGTDMSAPVDWLEENQLVGDACICLTDGECNWPSKRKFPYLAVITRSSSYGSEPEWGTVIHLDVNE
jgi:predicted metal-dependent peptidase